MHLRRLAVLASAAVLGATALAGCGSDTDSATATTPAADAAGAVTIYSGRNEELVGPLLAQIEAATGTKVEVRYGESSALAAQILEEGDASSADIFFSQDAGALGVLAKEGALAPLDATATGAVLPGFADPGGKWVATSARARVVAYNPELAPEAESFTTIDKVLDPAYKGKVGYAPTNASFHSFVTALRVAKGEDGARKWLEDFKANEPKAYEKNGAVLAAVDSGEVSLGLINHYYWHELVAEKGAENVTARIRFLGSDDPGALINVAGVGVLASSKRPTAAAKVVTFLVSEPAQQYFADETAEYPVIAGITTTKHSITKLEDLKGSSIDLNQLSSLEATLAMLDEVGLT